MLPQGSLSLLLSSLAWISLLGLASADERPCTAHADGKYYDLSSLKAKKDYEFKSPDGGDYILNICAPVSHETWALKVDKPEDVAGFTRRAHGDFSIGDYNQTVQVRDGHPMIVMTDGSRCPNAGDLTASTVVRFICDTSEYGAGQPQMIAMLPPNEDTACAFFVEWRTHVACPTHEPSAAVSFVTVVSIIAAVVFAVYMIGGTLYNRYVLELRGLDQIPRYSFFSLSDTVAFVQGCAEWVKDWWSSNAWSARGGGARWGSGGSWGGGGGSGYRGLGASPEEGQSMLSGPTGFLDEQDEDDEPEAPHPDDVESFRRPGMNADGVIRL